MDLRLTGKRALATGSSSRIGEAIVKLLAVEGAAVVVQGRNEGRANAVAAAALASGPIDILVNNAGFIGHLLWTEATATDWAETYDTNVISAV